MAKIYKISDGNGTTEIVYADTMHQSREWYLERLGIQIVPARPMDIYEHSKQGHQIVEIAHEGHDQG